MPLKNNRYVPSADDAPQKRIRASEHAIKTAIKAMQECGLSVTKVCINGGRIEIYTTAHDEIADNEEDSGLGKW